MAFACEKAIITVKLHFAEIMFSDDEPFSGDDGRILDVATQGNVVLKDFNIVAEAEGARKGIVKEFSKIYVKNFKTGMSFSPEVIVGIVLASCVVLVSTSVILRMTCYLGGKVHPNEVITELQGLDIGHFTLGQLKAATEDFSKKNKIGEGGFWPVYKQKGHGHQQLHLNYQTTKTIWLGIARGLAYLHEESRLKIVHRDIKVTNVLLDKDLSAKISDFSLAKLDEEETAHISTRVVGTIGYMTTKYAMRGYLTDKADVYRFGVVVLEIVSKKSDTKYQPKEEFVYLLDWVISSPFSQLFKNDY
ncbi:hypothetical protein Cgig2_010196 [Carnegiea gigantea]|uniref:non-specific serine/threonine protein kinase n=1 Tax=Carnegiea gigantea TaxID=171969 RepID=A0A9Q1GWE6_9CARY|nr:hypothetical protein Cgig2_010196 [Carnegiea gigantea]